jgi:hypothetical protein
MKQLPNDERAIFDIRKLKDYCLDLPRPRGRHKAQVFRKALGIEEADAACSQLETTASAERSSGVSE